MKIKIRKADALRISYVDENDREHDPKFYHTAKEATKTYMYYSVMRLHDMGYDIGYRGVKYDRMERRVMKIFKRYLP